MDLNQNNNDFEKNEDTSPRAPQNAVENFYERFRDVPLRNLDIFIGLCFAALVLVVVLGALKGNGII